MLVVGTPYYDPYYSYYYNGQTTFGAPPGSSFEIIFLILIVIGLCGAVIYTLAKGRNDDDGYDHEGGLETKLVVGEYDEEDPNSTADKV